MDDCVGTERELCYWVRIYEILHSYPNVNLILRMQVADIINKTQTLDEFYTYLVNHESVSWYTLRYYVRTSSMPFQKRRQNVLRFLMQDLNDFEMHRKMFNKKEKWHNFCCCCVLTALSAGSCCLCAVCLLTVAWKGRELRGKDTFLDKYITQTEVNIKAVLHTWRQEYFDETQIPVLIMLLSYWFPKTLCELIGHYCS